MTKAKADPEIEKPARAPAMRDRAIILHILVSSPASMLLSSVVEIEVGIVLLIRSGGGRIELGEACQIGVVGRDLLHQSRQRRNGFAGAQRAADVVKTLGRRQTGTLEHVLISSKFPRQIGRSQSMWLEGRPSVTLLSPRCAPRAATVR